MSATPSYPPPSYPPPSYPPPLLQELTRAVSRRFWRAFVVWVMFSIWEMIVVGLRAEWCAGCSKDSGLYFLLFHTGNLNNGVILAFAIWIALWRLWKVYDRARLLVIPSASSALAFLLWERNDLQDLPFALIGIMLCVYAVSDARFNAEPQPVAADGS